RQPTEAALPRTEFRHGRGEVGRAEVGPHRVGEVELGVGALPQQEIGEPLLAAGADQQVDVGEDTARTDRRPRRIVDREPQLERAAGHGGTLGGADGGHEWRREPIAAADYLEPDPLLEQAWRLAP